MQKIENKKQVNNFIFLCAVTYMVSYITRINYGAIVAEMEKSMQISRSLLSMAVTGSFITYGFGQIISGVLGDKFSPKKIVSAGFVLTAIMNFLIPFCKDPYLMCAVWCVNGFAQSLIWPPLVKLMAHFLSTEDYNEATLKVSWGSSSGTILIYLISPVLICYIGWKSVFIFSALCGALILFFWNKFAMDIQVGKLEKVITNTHNNKNKIFSPVMIMVLIAIGFLGMLRDGVTTWMPTYISDTYNLSSAVSILTGVVMPVFTIICCNITAKIYKERFKNPVKCAGVIFGAGAVASIGLCFLSDFNEMLSVFLSATLTGCMHGVNLLLVCMVPAFFKKSNNVSTASGIINSSVYVGSACSTYGIALVSETCGWHFTLVLWSVVAVLGTLICFFCARPWAKKYQMED